MTLPEPIAAERARLEAEIRAAFAGVSREGGVSWGWSQVHDGFGSRTPRLCDDDTHWTQLVDDPGWSDDPRIGGFCFLDAVGFRYYLPAAMIRALRQGWSDPFPFNLALRDPGSYRLAQWSALDQRQGACVAWFLRHMRDADMAEDRPGAREWEDAYRSHWHQFDDPPTAA